MQHATLGEFLRARRECAQAQDARARRRTPGLRREDVAERAGISVDWLARLEQNRAATVSDAVLDGLSRALGLVGSERTYLYRLAGRDVSIAGLVTDEPHRTALAVLAQVPDMPARVANSRGDVIANNTLHERLLLGYGDHPRLGRNLTWFIFCDPRAPDLFPDREADMERITSNLRLVASQPSHDPRLDALIGEMLIESEDFRRLWPLQTVRLRGRGRKCVHHPLAGPLEFAIHSLTPSGAPHQTIVFLEPVDAATRAGLDRLSAAG